MYKDLEDTELIKLSIDFIRTGEPMPVVIQDRLEELGLKELIMCPSLGEQDED